jgi:sarcosine oxidase, subunit gamma
MADREVDRPSIVASVSPLAGLALPVSDGLVQVREAPASGRLVLRAGPDSARRLASAMGTALEGRINRAVTVEGCAALRLGPDEWLLLADAEGDPWLAARLAEAGRGVPMAVVDVTHRSAGVLIEGTGVEDVLAAGCPLPLDGMGFPVGRATRTVIGKAEVVLWRQSEDRFRVEVATSFAAYLIAYLGAAIADEAMIRRARLQPGQ